MAKKAPSPIGNLVPRNKEIPEELKDKVIEIIREDINHDWSAIDDLLNFVPQENLIAFLREEDWTLFAKPKPKTKKK
jgi:CO dehydrogenase/acetyl-CoA synthase beta subunit